MYKFIFYCASLVWITCFYLICINSVKLSFNYAVRKSLRFSWFKLLQSVQRNSSVSLVTHTWSRNSTRAQQHRQQKQFVEVTLKRPLPTNEGNQLQMTKFTASFCKAPHTAAMFRSVFHQSKPNYCSHPFLMTVNNQTNFVITPGAVLQRK